MEKFAKFFNNKTHISYIFGSILALSILYAILSFQIPAVRMRVFVFALWFSGEIYLWVSILKSFRRTWNKRIPFFSLFICYWLPACMIGVTMLILAVKGVHQLNKTLYLTVVGVCVIQYLIKFIIFIFVLMYDIFSSSIKIFNKSAINEKGKRRLLRISLGIYFVAFILMVYGILWGAGDFQIKEIDFEGNRGKLREKCVSNKHFSEIKIVHISDLHLASWRNQSSIAQAVQIVNDQQPDFLFITGDLVQFVSDEFVEYLPILSRLKAQYGIYSVLGNHDYGRYARFKTDAERKEDVQNLINYQNMLDWKVLNNESVKLYSDTVPLGITIAGGEFYLPKKMFINEGDLVKTFQNVDTCDYIILLSHDPQAWDDVIRYNYPANLTLSGHTHGMQLGFYSKRCKFSPASLLYKHWGGLYEKQGKSLYVNVGLGSVGFPARIGMAPEITVIRIR